jgi:hypothetical protein
MLHKGRMFIIALGLVCASVASAQADLCFVYSGGGGTVVGDRFTLPLTNQCKPFNGFELGAGSTAGAITGTGCTASNGGQFLLHYSFHNWFALGGGSYFESGTCRFPLARGPALESLPSSGICRGTFVTPSGQNGFVQDARIFNCNRDVPAADGP